MNNYNIAVIGPIPRDHITTHTGQIIEKFGGVNNPVIGISKLLGTSGTVYPISHVRKADQRAVNAILEPYPNVNCEHITSDKDMGDIISLTFVNQNKRLERQTGMMNPIVPKDMEPLLFCDVFVFVPITDFEVPLETVKYVKEKSRGVIIFDAHGPTNTLTIHGERVMRFWADRDLWLPYIDVLKMNLEESHACWFKQEYTAEELNDLDFDTTDHLPAFAKHVLGLGVKALIVTLDNRGCVIYTPDKDGYREEFIKSVKVDRVVDTTGCGDSFAGGLGFGLLAERENYARAVKYANALGAQRTQGTNFEVFKSLTETDEMIAANYH